MSRAAAGLEVAVIGAGVFGVVTALRLAAAGHRVTLFDRATELLRGASGHANRVHQGYHYPRHEPTARQCLAGHGPFAAAFAAAMLPGVTNDYFIAEAGSLTEPAAFLAFCDRLGLPYRLVDPEATSPRMRQVALGLRTDEGLFDAAILRRLLLERLGRSGVQLRLGSEVGQLARRGTGFALTAGGETLAADAVVNCGYAEINRLTARLGHPMPPRQYEYTVAPVIAPPWTGPASVTVMDGPFFSLLPMDRDGRQPAVPRRPFGRRPERCAAARPGLACAGHGAVPGRPGRGTVPARAGQRQRLPAGAARRAAARLPAGCADGPGRP